MFDVLMKIYESYGYTAREAVASIVENNIYGLDIDDRAAQLAYFAVMMKARQYDRRFFSRGIQPHVYAIVESNHVDKFAVEYFCNGDARLKTAMDTIISELHDAKEYGSILTVTSQDGSALYERFAEIMEDIHMSRETALRELLPLVQVAEALAQKYDVVVTNPPYMGSSGMSSKLSNFVKENYPDSKSDLFAVFIERCNEMTRKNGYQTMITQHAWMFLSGFEKLRNKLLVFDIVNMAHLGIGTFEDLNSKVVQSVSFVFRKAYHEKYKGCYNRLFEKQGLQEDNAKKEIWLVLGTYKFVATQTNFSQIPGSPVAYWVSNRLFHIFLDYPSLENYASPKQGLITGDNERFLRFWHEVPKVDIAFERNDTVKWMPINKGGDFRRWSGNQEYVINWENKGVEILNFKDTKGKLRSRPQNLSYNFKESISWSLVTSGGFSARYYPEYFMFNVAGICCFPESHLNYILGLLNTKITSIITQILNPTINMNAGDVAKLPIVVSDKKEPVIESLVKELRYDSKQDWDSFETSWDFQHHPLIHKVSTIAEAFNQWQAECDDRFSQLKVNEEELNRIFIAIYGLQDEMTPEVEDKDVTVRKADLGRDIRSFISYAVGCMFGRYSLDVDGLAYAGGEWDNSKYASFPADKDNIIPICDDEYFEDDIVGLFVEFVKTVYGAETLDENLKFIADALGGKGQPKEVIRNYFLNDFYADHCKIYQKRPIYWLFDSGKKNGFKALIYMHRYQPDTIARIRTDYVHEHQARYRTAIADLEQRIANASTGERVKLNKKLTALQAQDTEIRTYEEKIHHLADQMISIDLDDGVKKNYAMFQDVLAKIK